MIRVAWDVEELVALIDVYRNSAGKSNWQIENELERLSVMLERRAQRLHIAHDEKFRNMNGMRLMYQNVTYVATDGQQGMPAASTGMRKVWGLLQKAPEVLEMILLEFTRRYGC